TPATSGADAPAPTNTRDAGSDRPTVDNRSDAQRTVRGVSLPGGSWIDLGLALALAAAVALVWAHRQRRHVPRNPSTPPRGSDATLAPMPRVIGQIRRALRHTYAAHPDTPPREAPAHRAGDAHPGDPTHNPAEIPDSESGDAHAATSGGYPAPLAPSLAHPVSAVWPPAGLGLTGPGAHAAARGFLTAALAAAGEHPDACARVVMPSATAATLLDTAADTLPHTPRLTITANLDDALDLLEAQALHRARLLCHHEVDTVRDLRAADPYEEPLPPITLIADTARRGERARAAALLTQGQRLDIHGVLLCAWPDGNTIDVADDGATTPADDDTRRPGAHLADAGRFTVVTPTETLDLLATLAEAHTGEAPHPTPAPTCLGDTVMPEPDAPHPPSVTSAAAGSGSGLSPIGAHGAGARDNDRHAPAAGSDEPTTVESDPAPVSSGPVEAGPAADTRARVGVRVLGAPGIVDGDQQRGLRAKSLELLVYLAARDGSAPAEAILDDLLPDAPSSKAVHRLHTYVSDLRAVLRHNGGNGTYLTHPDHRYELNPDRLDVDLWRMRAAIRAADAATSTHERVAALRRAVDAYRQPLAEGCAWEWLEPYREAVRQEALAATLALIEELDGHPSEQRNVLDAALTHHPYVEELYQTAMRARAQLGDVDGVRALRRTLTRRLSEIDAEPTDDTLTLADRLIADLRRHGRASGTRRQPNADGVPT
ncbi:BTAD domain-containing putative transcriptional regulator, partial [Micromonospora sp. 4G55]|uniref:AfsR/SARP family transcriptional regulator n=1 Tax=Micromonospora sp. 4G55 TaxID=2806102 RepID=UPI001A401EC9